MTAPGPWSAARLGVVQGEAPGEPERRAAALLVDRAQRRSGATLELLDAPPAGWAPGEPLPGFDAAVFLGRPAGNRALGALLRLAGLRAPDDRRPGPEGFHVRTMAVRGQAQAVVAGADERGTLYGVGHFLRALTYRDQTVEIPPLDDAQAPAFRYRGQELRQFANPTIPALGMRPWEASDWEEQIADLALWGCNLIRRQTTWYWFDAWRSEVEGTPRTAAGGLDPAAWAAPRGDGGHASRMWRLETEVCRIIRRYGLDVGVYCAPNTVAEAWTRGQQMTPEMHGTHAYPRLVCASHPDTLARIRWERDLLFRELPAIDHFFFPSGDSAGCSCPACRPWAQTYLRICEEQAAHLRRYHPRAEVWLTNQHLDAEQDQLLWDHLRRHRPGWVTGYQYGPAGNQMSPYIRAEVSPRWFTYRGGGHLNRYLAEIRAQLPPEVALTLFPDLTHWIQSQYALEDTDPAIAALHTRRTYFVRPRDFRRVFDATAPLSSGSVPYTEGIYDDVNRALWLQWEWDPRLEAGLETRAPTAEADGAAPADRAVRPHLERYARWWFGDAAAADVAGVYLTVEQSWKGPIRGNETVPRLRQHVEALEARLPERFRRANWRWLLLKLRVLTDDLLQRKLEGAVRAAAAVQEAVRRGEPAPDAADLDRRLAAALRTLDEALAERHLAPLKAQVLALDEAVHATPGARIHLPLIRNLDVDAGHLRWDRQRLADARARLAAGDRDGAWMAACEVAGYEDPGPGGWYDDLGHPGRAPHLRRGHGATLLQPMDPQNRPSHNTLARTYRGEPGVLLSGDGLDPGAAYVVKVTYAGPPGRTPAVQRLEANGREVHPELEVPARTARQLTFAVPRDAYPFGHLDLEWFPATSRGNGGTAVSEVWVMRAPGGAPRG